LTLGGESVQETADRAIKLLRDKIKTPRDGYSHKTRKLIVNFQKIIDGLEILFPGGMHCEALLATLSKYFESALTGDNDANLISTCKVLLFTFTYFLLDLTIRQRHCLNLP
jgi:hypothetical protein